MSGVTAPRRRPLRLSGYDYTAAGAYFITVVTLGREPLLGQLEGDALCLTAAGEAVLAAWAELPRHFPLVATDTVVLMPNHVHGIVVLGPEELGLGVTPPGEIKAPRPVGVGFPDPPDSSGAETAPLRVAVEGVLRGDTEPLAAARTSGGQGVGAGFPDPVAGGMGREGGETPPLRLARRVTLGQVVGYFKYQSAKSVNHLRGKPGLQVWQRNYYEHILRGEAELNRAREYIRTNPLRWTLDRENPDCVLPRGKERP